MCEAKPEHQAPAFSFKKGLTEAKALYLTELTATRHPGGLSAPMPMRTEEGNRGGPRILERTFGQTGAGTPGPARSLTKGPELLLPALLQQQGCDPSATDVPATSEARPSVHSKKIGETNAPLCKVLDSEGWFKHAEDCTRCAEPVLLVISAAAKWMPILTPLAAAALALESLALAGLYARHSLELTAANPLVWAVVMGLLAAFVAYGRYALGLPTGSTS